jgi:hypothetical protein
MYLWLSNLAASLREARYHYVFATTEACLMGEGWCAGEAFNQGYVATTRDWLVTALDDLSGRFARKSVRCWIVHPSSWA